MASEIVGTIIGATTGVGVALIGVPLGISALGFTAGGIAAGSIAAKMMSAAAIANSGGVAAGSTVAVLQSVGAAGVRVAAKIMLSSTLGWLGRKLVALFFCRSTAPGGKPKESQQAGDGTRSAPPTHQPLCSCAGSCRPA